MESKLVFSPQRAAEFWTELTDVLDRYPEVMHGLATCYRDQDPLDEDDADRITVHGPFDEESPTFVQGIVLLCSIRNMQGYETMFTSAPPDQSMYVTDGMIANRAARI